MQRTADVIFIVAVLALAGMSLHNRFAAEPVASEARENFFPDSSVSSELASQRSSLTVLLILSSECRFCDESAPLYRRLRDLAASSGGALAVTAVGREPRDELAAYLRSKDLADVPIPDALPPPRFPGTPTLLVLEPGGRVLASWVGRLSERQEMALRAGLVARQF